MWLSKYKSHTTIISNKRRNTIRPVPYRIRKWLPYRTQHAINENRPSHMPASLPTHVHYKSELTTVPRSWMPWMWSTWSWLWELQPTQTGCGAEWYDRKERVGRSDKKRGMRKEWKKVTDLTWYYEKCRDQAQWLLGIRYKECSWKRLEKGSTPNW